MLSGDSSYEFLSGIEDNFGPRVYGSDVARLKPAKHFVAAKDTKIEPAGRRLPMDPFTKQETDEIMADWTSREEQGECGL